MPLADKELVAFGQAVRELRAERRMTQEDLAYKISLTVSQLSRIERGQVNPKWRTVTRIAGGLGLGPVELAAKAEEIRQMDGDPDDENPPRSAAGVG
jgi:transcriptional regulator with XRE-family HTH domain